MAPTTTQDFNLSKNEIHAQFDDYEIAAQYAQKVGKPVMIDFTGWGCVNCRKMEVAVWSDPNVGNMIKNDYVLVSLYDDDKTSLLKDQQYVSDFSGKRITTVGNKWSDFQARFFGGISQPYYILLDNKGRMLQKPRAYNEDVEAYKKWLIAGMVEYHKRTEKSE